MDRPDLYVLLGVPEDATPSQIQTAYRERARVYHPDRFNPNTQPRDWAAANALLRELNTAYYVLSDPSRRAQYDASFHSIAHEQTVSATPTPKPRTSHVPAQRRTSGASLGRFLAYWLLGLLILAASLSIYITIRREVQPETMVAERPPQAQIQPALAGCEPGVEETALPDHGAHWRYDSSREPLAPLEVQVSADRHFLVKVEEAGRPVAAMLLRPGSTAEMAVPLGAFVLKYATGSGEHWCGHEASYPFGLETSFHKANELFHFRDAGDHYAGYTVELILQRDGNLRTDSIPPEDW